MVTLIMVFVLIAVLAAYYCWSTETAASLMELTVWVADAESASVTALPSPWKRFSRKGVKQYLHKAFIEDELEDICLPKKSNHLFSEATYGEWGKIGFSHYGKGVTIRDYRRGSHLSKKVLHPCMVGEPSGYYD